MKSIDIMLSSLCEGDVIDLNARRKANQKPSQIVNSKPEIDTVHHLVYVPRGTYHKDFGHVFKMDFSNSNQPPFKRWREAHSDYAMDKGHAIMMSPTTEVQKQYLDNWHSAWKAENNV